MCNIWAGDPSLLRLQVAVVVVILEAKVSVIISSSLPDMKVKFCKIYNHNEAMLYHTKITINGKNIFSAESTLICLQDVKLSLD
jgi:hypothetical protein